MQYYSRFKHIFMYLWSTLLFNFFIEKFLQHILSAWNGYRSFGLEFSILRNWKWPFCAFLKSTLDFSLDFHLLNSLAQKSCRHSPKLLTREKFLSIFHVGRHSFGANWILWPTFVRGWPLSESFVVKLICQWPGPISKWCSTRLADQVCATKLKKANPLRSQGEMPSGLLTISGLSRPAQPN